MIIVINDGKEKKKMTVTPVSNFLSISPARSVLYNKVSLLKKKKKNPYA